MKFKKDGKVYVDMVAGVYGCCDGLESCSECKLHKKTGGLLRSCLTYARLHPKEVARVLGYEVIEDDTPDIREAVEKYGENVKPDPTWQERMQKEYRELKERYENLHKMVTKYEAGTLGFTPNCSLELLCQQKRHMGEYLHDLEIRAEIEGVNLYD